MIASPPEHRPLLIQCAGILIVAVLVRVGVGIALGAFQRAPGGEIFAVAQSIATEGVFGNPGGAPSGPTAHVAPVYPYLLAVLFRVAPPAIFPPLVTTLNILIASLMWALLPIAAVRLSLPGPIGVLAGVLGAVNPIRHWVELNGYWEATLSGIAIMGLIAFTFGRKADWTRPSLALTIGFFWGLLVLLQPAAVTVFVVLLGVLAFTPAPRSAKLTALGLALGAFLVALTPWTIRNYQTLGGLIFVRGDLGIELSVSNNDGALPSHENVLRNPQARHPHVSAVEFAKRNEMGELRYDRSRLKEAVAWMAANPSRLVPLTARRVRSFWIPERDRAVFSLVEWATAGLACVGLWSLFESRAAARWLFIGVWLVYPLLYYVIQADERYRYPIEWSITLIAAVGVFRVLGGATLPPAPHEPDEQVRGAGADFSG